MSEDYDAQDDMRQSIAFYFAAIRERVAQGGPGWKPPTGAPNAKGAADMATPSPKPAVGPR